MTTHATQPTYVAKSNADRCDVGSVNTRHLISRLIHRLASSLPRLFEQSRDHPVIRPSKMLQCLVAGIAFCLASFSYGQGVFTTTSFVHSLDETSANADLAALNGKIDGSFDSGVGDDRFADFTYSLDAAGATKFSLTTQGSLGVVFKTGASLDYEATRTFSFRITAAKNASSTSTLTANSLTVSLGINNVNEKPFVTADYKSGESSAGRVFYIQRTPDTGNIPFITVQNNVFRDPEGINIQLKDCADDFAVSEYDSSANLLIGSETQPNPRGGFDTDASGDETATGRSRYCPLPSDTTNYTASRDVTRGGQVVNVTTFGPTLQISPVASSTSGVRRAVVTFRGWAGTPLRSPVADGVENILVSEEAKITVYVKTGVNNPPSFIATGYTYRVNETTADEIVDVGPQPTYASGSWNATDIDGDTIVYSLEGSTASAACAPTGVKAVALGQGCVWLDPVTLATGGVQLKGRHLDYETAPAATRTYTITLVADDGYAGTANAGRVPINITILNVDEGLDFSGPIAEVSQLVLGRAGRTVDLNKYFSDPDGTPITYTVFSGNPGILTVSISGSLLTATPVAAGSSTITIQASSGAGTIPRVVSQAVTVRQTNRAPSFLGGINTVAVPQPVSENQATGHVMRVPSLRYIDPDGDTVTATVLNSSLFEAVVNPTIGGQTRTGEIAIKLIGSLDFETAPRHTFQVQLSDGWDTSATSVNVIVDVSDVNEPPTVATDAQGNPRTIPAQTVAVNGTGSIDVSSYFTDPERGRLQYDAAVVTGSSYISATVVGFSTVQFTGLQATGTTPATVLVTVRDSGNLTATIRFNVSVTSNNPPVVANPPSNQTVRIGTAVSIPLTGAFVDNDAGDRVVRYEASSNDDTIVLAQSSSDGQSMVLIPRAEGSTTIQITAIDSRGGRGTTTISVTVLGNTKPVVTTPISTVELRPNEVSTGIELTSHFSDPDGDTMTFTAASDQPNIATVSVQGSVLTIQGRSRGTTTVTVTATDPDRESEQTTFQVAVRNDPPSAQTTISLDLSHRGDTASVNLTTIFSDPDGDAMTFEATSWDTSIATVDLVGTTLSVQAVGVGSTVVAVTATDAFGLSGTTSFTVSIANQAPIVVMAIGDQNANRVTPAAVNLANVFSDPAGDALTYSAVSSNPSVVSVSINGATLSIEGVAIGSATVTVTASDTYGDSVSTDFDVTVVNLAPVVAMEIADQNANRIAATTVDLVNVFSDPEGDPLTYSAVSDDTSAATVSLDGTTLSILGVAIGSATVTVTASDSFGDSISTDFDVTVVNQAPVVAMEISDQNANRITAVAVDLVNVFSDPESDELTYSAMSDDTSVATVSLSGATLSILGVAIGTATVTVTASDSYGDSVSTDFDVTVVNQAPTNVVEIARYSLQVGGEAASQDVAAAFSDDDSAPLVFTATTANENVATASVSGSSVSVSPVSAGGTMVLITATDSDGASIEVNVGVVVSDSEIKAVANTGLASFARAMLSSVSATVASRLMADADGLYTPFASYSLDDFSPADDYVITPNIGDSLMPPRIENDAWRPSDFNQPSTLAHRDFNQFDALLNQGFALKLAAAGDPTFWTIWGGLDRQSFEAPNHEGTSNSFYFGADVTFQGQWTVGVGIGKTTGEVDYSYGTATQVLDNDVTQVLPYVRMQPSDRTTLYGVAGVSSGTVESTVVGASSSLADLKGTIGLFGGRQVMFTAANGLNLSIVGDVGFSNLESDSGDFAAQGLLAEVSRFRGGLETSFNMLMGADGSFTPFLTVGFRSDSGDGLAESGVEVSGGVRIANPILAVDANFRTLATSGADDYSESGFSIMALLNPTAGATGLSVSLSPSWGAGTMQTNAIWRDDFQASQMPADFASWGIHHQEGMKLDSSISYGWKVKEQRFLLTPFVEVQSGYSTERDVSVGARLKQLERASQNLSVSVQLGQDSTFSGTQQEAIRVNARLNF